MTGGGEGNNVEFDAKSLTRSVADMIIKRSGCEKVKNGIGTAYIL